MKKRNLMAVALSLSCVFLSSCVKEYTCICKDDATGKTISSTTLKLSKKDSKDFCLSSPATGTTCTKLVK